MVVFLHVVLGVAALLVVAWGLVLVVEGLSARDGSAPPAMHRLCTRLQLATFAAIVVTSLIMVPAAGNSPVGRLALFSLPVCGVLLWATLKMRRGVFEER